MTGDMRRRAILVAALVIVVIIAVTAGVWYSGRGGNQGWDTTCGELLDMTPAQRAAVMKEAGVEAGHEDERARFYTNACAPHPEDRDEPIGDINP